MKDFLIDVFLGPYSIKTNLKRKLKKVAKRKVKEMTKDNK